MSVGELTRASWSYDMPIEVGCRLAVAWGRLWLHLGRVIGEERAARIAAPGMKRLARWRLVGERKWRKFSASAFDVPSLPEARVV
jgi:hypothetical protein